MPKLLGDFLQEQQEPFALDVYLLERGCSRARLMNLDLRSVKRRYPIPNCSNFVKAVFSRLVFNNQKIKNGGCNEEHADDDKLSSSTVYNSCAESSEVEDALVEGDAERKVKWRSVEDSNKQLSPISVLEETESDEEEDSPLHQNKLCTDEDKMKSRQGECSSYNNVEELQELVDSKMYGQYMINKRTLQETKQLLIDCVREVIESHKKNGEQLKKILGADELWKLVCENVWLWSQDSVDETNLVHLLHYHFMASQQDWNSAFDQQKEEVSMEIGDSILEGVINEILTSL